VAGGDNSGTGFDWFRRGNGSRLPTEPDEAHFAEEAAMRKLSLVLGVLVVAALALAPLAPAWAGSGKKTHDVNVTIVSLDEKAKMVTFKTETGEEKSAPVTGQAINKMKGLKAGDAVILTCTDKETGEHESITDIKTAAPKG
jgi:hypothetical protein